MHGENKRRKIISAGSLQGFTDQIGYYRFPTSYKHYSKSEPQTSSIFWSYSREKHPIPLGKLTGLYVAFMKSRSRRQSSKHEDELALIRMYELPSPDNLSNSGLMGSPIVAPQG